MKKLESSKVIAGRSYEKEEWKQGLFSSADICTGSCLQGSQNIHRMRLSYNSAILKFWCLFSLNIWQMKDGSKAPVFSIYSILCTRDFSRGGRGCCSVYHIMGTHKRYANQSQVHFRVTQHIWPITQHAILAHAHRVSHRVCIGSLSDSIPPHPTDPPPFPLFLALDILST